MEAVTVSSRSANLIGTLDDDAWLTSPITEQKQLSEVLFVDQTTVKNCMASNCGAEFSTVLRKHHCRACGKVFCGKCSKKVRRKVAVPCNVTDQQLMLMSRRLCSSCRLQGTDGISSNLKGSESNQEHDIPVVISDVDDENSSKDQNQHKLSRQEDAENQDNRKDVCLSKTKNKQIAIHRKPLQTININTMMPEQQPSKEKIPPPPLTTTTTTILNNSQTTTTTEGQEKKHDLQKNPFEKVTISLSSEEKKTKKKKTYSLLHMGVVIMMGLLAMSWKSSSSSLSSSSSTSLSSLSSSSLSSSSRSPIRSTVSSSSVEKNQPVPDVVTSETIDNKQDEEEEEKEEEGMNNVAISIVFIDQRSNFDIRKLFPTIWDHLSRLFLQMRNWWTNKIQNNIRNFFKINNKLNKHISHE